jgi:hypothetical protein
MIVRRGKMVVCMAPMEDDTAGGAGGGGEAGLDLAAAGEQLSADLFGGSPEVPVEDDLGLGGEGAAPPVEEKVAAPTTAPVVTDPTASALQAPKTWRPEAAAKFSALPPEVQQEVLKREEDIFKGLEAYKADAGIGKAVKSVLQPYMKFKTYA